MHKTFYAAALLTLAATAAFAQQTAKPGAPPMAMPTTKSANAEKLMANENKLLDAVKAKDAKAFSSLVKPGSWSIDPAGYMAVDEFTKMLGDPKSDMKIEMLKASNMRVIDLTPTVSLVTYKTEQKGSFMGQPFPPVVYASTIWVNEGGTWRAVFHQESPAEQMPPKK